MLLQLSTTTTIGLTFGQILSLIALVVTIVGFFWKIKLEINALRAHINLEVSKVKSEVSQIKTEANMYRNTHERETKVSEEHFKEWVLNNNKQHEEMFDRINGIYNLLIESKSKK
jgi:hypothetical protein